MNFFVVNSLPYRKFASCDVHKTMNQLLPTVPTQKRAPARTCKAVGLSVDKVLC